MKRVWKTAQKILRFRIPSNQRVWSKDLEVFPEIIFNNDQTITIRNIRNCTYKSVTDYTVGHYDRTIILSDIETVWFMVEPFSLVAAHTLVSFGLKDGTYITISVEIRKQVGQKFSQLMVLFFLRRHELIYVIGDERDLIKLRTNYRKDKVYLYPGNAPQEKIQELFIHMLKRADTLQKNPEFYNPFTNTCLTNIVDHVNAVDPGRIPFSFKILIATLSDKLAYSLGLFGRTLPFKQLKQQCYITERAIQYGDDPEFSKKIRTPML